MTDAMALLCLLIGLELVLGVDNVLVMAIMVGRLPESQQQKARILGLGFALLARVAMLFLVLALTNLTQPLVYGMSIRDLILLAGGLFLLWKAVREIHYTVELRDEQEAAQHGRAHGYWAVVSELVLLDIVFSIDSVITAVGLTQTVWIIMTSVLVAFVAILLYARAVGNFILRHPTLKILALSFLITIGVTIFMEGIHKEVPKAYIYLPMGFALFVELLQTRYEYNKKHLLKGQ